MEHPAAGTVCSSVRALSCLWPDHPSRRPSHRHAVRLTWGRGAKGHALSTVCATFVTVGAAIENGAALAPRGQGLKRSGATCVTHASLSIFGSPTTSSSTTAKPIPMFGCRTTASCAGRAGWSTIPSSSSSSPFTCLKRPELGSITCPKTRSIVGRVSRRYSLATLRAHRCGPAIHGM
jgi:hypothetical protein